MSSRIACFSSCNVCGQFQYTNSLKYPQRKQSRTRRSGNRTSHGIPYTWKWNLSLIITLHTLPNHCYWTGFEIAYHHLFFSMQTLPPIIGQKCIMQCVSWLCATSIKTFFTAQHIIFATIMVTEDLERIWKCPQPILRYSSNTCLQRERRKEKPQDNQFLHSNFNWDLMSTSVIFGPQSMWYKHLMISTTWWYKL